jgi:pimeloyl-ACP methyl ester carboxylesterase
MLGGHRRFSARPPRPLAADVRGTGVPGRPAVVLLHGQPGSRSDWQEVADDLARDHMVVVPDRLGWGETGGRAGGFAANASAVAKLLSGLGIPRAVVAAHSWSGGVALELAAVSPDRVAGLVLVASVAPGDPLSRVDRLLAAPLVGGVLTAATLAAAGRLLSSGPGRAIAGRRLQGHDHQLPDVARMWRRRSTWHSFAAEQQALAHELPRLANHLGSITVPAVVLVGSADRVVRPGAGRRLAAELPGASLEVVQGAGHLLPQVHPATVAAAVRRLAAGMTVAGTAGA